MDAARACAAASVDDMVGVLDAWAQAVRDDDEAGCVRTRADASGRDRTRAAAVARRPSVWGPDKGPQLLDLLLHAVVPLLPEAERAPLASARPEPPVLAPPAPDMARLRVATAALRVFRNAAPSLSADSLPPHARAVATAAAAAVASPRLWVVGGSAWTAAASLGARVALQCLHNMLAATADAVLPAAAVVAAAAAALEAALPARDGPLAATAATALLRALWRRDGDVAAWAAARALGALMRAALELAGECAERAADAADAALEAEGEGEGEGEGAAAPRLALSLAPAAGLGDLSTRLAWLRALEAAADHAPVGLRAVAASRAVEALAREVAQAAPTPAPAAPADAVDSSAAREHAVEEALRVQCAMAACHVAAAVLAAATAATGAAPAALAGAALALANAAADELERIERLQGTGPVGAPLARRAAGGARVPDGYRTALLRALANALHSRPAVAEATAAREGLIGRVLSSTRLDPAHPLQREWAVLAVQAWCAGSARAQAVVAGLRAVAVSEAPELRALGVKAELDDATGRVRVRSAAPGPRAGAGEGEGEGGEPAGRLS
jgi:hypothetical protein